jgi:5'-nucleotidase
LGAEVKPVPFLDQTFDEKQKGILKQAEEELGPRAITTLAKLDPEKEDSPMGMLLAHILLERYPEAQIALFNESGIRAEIVAGPITVGDVFEVFPFESGPAFLKLKGSELQRLLRVAASGAHGLPIVRGLRLEIDRMRDECIAEDFNGDGKKEKWERNLLVSAELENGSPIDPQATYTIVSSSYLAEGGSDFDQIVGRNSAIRPTDFQSVRASVNEWMRKNPVELGGPSDRFTRAITGPLVRVRHFDHQVGSTCPQPQQ